MGPFKADWSEADVEATLARGIPDELLYVPIVVGLNAGSVDRVWAEDICLALANHSHTQTRCNAMIGLGHIARVCGELSLERVLPAVSAALADSNEQIRGHAEDTACDIHHYLGVVTPGHDPTRTEAHYEFLRTTAETLIRRAHGEDET